MGFAVTALAALAQPNAIPANARRGAITQISRSLSWSQEALGVEFGPPATLLAPLG
jgi:hypothetical protein